MKFDIAQVAGIIVVFWIGVLIITCFFPKVDYKLTRMFFCLFPASLSFRIIMAEKAIWLGSIAETPKERNDYGLEAEKYLEKAKTILYEKGGSIDNENIFTEQIKKMEIEVKKLTGSVYEIKFGRNNKWGGGV